MIIRSSVLSAIKLCPQRAFFKYNLGLIKKDAAPSVDLAFGKVVHKAIEIFHTKSLGEALHYLEEVKIPQTNAKNTVKAKLLLEAYAHSNPLELISSEKEFTFKIGNHKWIGRFDGVAKHLDGIYIVEHKTTNPYFLQHKPNDQFIAYWGGGRIFYHDVDGIILNSLDPSSLTVKRFVISFTKREFEQWITETKLVLAFYQRCLTAQTFPKNPSACMSYGRKCSYNVLCTASKDIHANIIDRFFTVDEKLKKRAW